MVALWAYSADIYRYRSFTGEVTHLTKTWPFFIYMMISVLISYRVRISLVVYFNVVLADTWQICSLLLLTDNQCAK